MHRDLPFGSFVRLNTGYYGIVTSRNHRSLLKPNVLILFDKEKRPQPSALIDLSLEKDGNGNYRYSIEEVLDPAPWGIDINQYISAQVDSTLS